MKSHLFKDTKSEEETKTKKEKLTEVYSFVFEKYFLSQQPTNNVSINSSVNNSNTISFSNTMTNQNNTSMNKHTMQINEQSGKSLPL